MQPLTFTHNGTVYTRTINANTGRPTHKAGNKFITTAIFDEMYAAYTQASSDTIAATLAAAPSAAPVAPPAPPAEGTQATEAPAAPNPFAQLLNMGNAALAQAAAGTPAKPPRKRAEQINGVSRPAGSGACAQVWAICDAINNVGRTPQIKDVKAQAAAQGLDATTTQVQYYRWRKHHGIKGRL